jgi:hypothetical protein
MYKIYKKIYMGVTSQCVIRTDGPDSYTSFLFDPDNTDYQAYLAWLAEGNVPQEAEE